MQAQGIASCRIPRGFFEGMKLKRTIAKTKTAPLAALLSGTVDGAILASFGFMRRSATPTFPAASIICADPDAFSGTAAACPVSVKE